MKIYFITNNEEFQVQLELIEAVVCAESETDAINIISDLVTDINRISINDIGIAHESTAHGIITALYANY